MPSTQPIAAAPFTRHNLRLLQALFLVTLLCGVAMLVVAVDGGAAGWLALPGVLAATAALLGMAILSRETAGQRQDADAFASLAQARQAAENASRAKSRYLATVSHEIRSPLNAIYGYAQLVERDDGVSPQEAATVIRRSAEHLTGLVEGLLDIAQLEFGVLRLRNEVVRFGHFIDQIVRMMQPAAAAKGLKFIYVAPARMPDHVRLDQSRFRQVLINLLSNAIKFTDTGSVTLHIRYSGQIATLEVRDTGPGIAARDRERIFEPFARGSDAEPGGDAPNPASRPGAGLGLAIARAIVQILGGKLELESEVGVGTIFRVTMMLNEVAGFAMPPTAEAAPRRLSGYEGGRRRILLVEDNEDQRTFLQKLLCSVGFDVVAAPSGEAAMEADFGAGFDLAILDISLPGISGWQVALGLREKLGEELRILMLSANSEEFHRPDFATPVHDLFLVKPVEFENLVEAIGGLLKLGWRWTVADRKQEEVAETPEDRSIGDGNEAIRTHVRQLQDVLRIGHVRGIEAEIKKLAEVGPDAEPLVAKLYLHLDRYDLAGMARLLEEC